MFGKGAAAAAWRPFWDWDCDCDVVVAMRKSKRIAGLSICLSATVLGVSTKKQYMTMSFNSDPVDWIMDYEALSWESESPMVLFWLERVMDCLGKATAALAGEAGNVGLS